MLLTDTNNIKEVMLFPAMKPTQKAAEEQQVNNDPIALKISSPDQYHVQIVGNFTKANLTVSTLEPKEKHTALSTPFIQTTTGEVISEATAIGAHLARMNPSAGLQGATPFEEAQVNQWVEYSYTISQVSAEVSKAIQGPAKDFKEKNYAHSLKSLKAHASGLNAHLKGKKWIVGNNPTLADIAVGVALTTAFQLVLHPAWRAQNADISAWFSNWTGLAQVQKAAGSIQVCEAATHPAGFEEEAEKPAAADDDELDLFVDDNSDDAEAAAAAAARVAAAKAKKPKKKVVAMSLVMLEVKPLDDTINLDDVAKRMFSTIVQEGLFWKTEYKKEPVAFGIFKLIVGFSLEDEKVSVDEVVEKIEAMEDLVQSVEIAAFNKI